MVSMDRVALGTYPTPVERVELAPRSGAPTATLWVKRDDLVSPLYGGNKVRKLEYLLAAAKEAGASRVLTLGAAGSHHVVAVAVFARRVGLAAEAVLVPQPASKHAADNLRAALAQGLEAHPVGAWALAPMALLRARAKGTFFIPLGGSNALGSMGYVDAVAELAQEVERGAMPEPDVIVVACGSGGTVAGLAAGLERAGMRTRVVGVAVADPVPIVARMTEWTTRRTALRAGVSPDGAWDRVEIEGRHVGHGYAVATEWGARAAEEAAMSGLGLDPTYTEKAYAAALGLARSRRDGTVLYWHTLSSAPLTALQEGGPAALPADLAALLRE